MKSSASSVSVLGVADDTEDVPESERIESAYFVAWGVGRWGKNTRDLLESPLDRVKRGDSE